MYIVAVDDGHGLETAGKRTPAFPGTEARYPGERIQFRNKAETVSGVGTLWHRIR